MRCVPDSEKRRMAEVLFGMNEGYKNVAHALGVSIYTAKYWMLRRKSTNNQFDTGIDSETTYSHVRYTVEERRKAVEDVLNGKMSLKECSRQLGACPKTIRGWIKLYLRSAGLCKTFGNAQSI